MTFKKFFACLIALFQWLSVTLGVTPYETQVNYGGTEYVGQTVTNWLTLIENGASGYRIIVGESCEAAETMAANELQSFLKQISGATLPIVNDSAPHSQLEIVVGKTNRENLNLYTVDRNSLGDEGFVLKTAGSTLVIAGGTARGTLYGAYTFLEEQLGCRWYTPTLSYIPQNTTVKINADLNDTQTPDFEIRRNCTIGATSQYNAIKKINTLIYENKPEYGGSNCYVMWDVTMTKLVPDSLFETHPEYFAYDADTGVRSTTHVCMSSEGALQEAIVNARAYILNNTTGAKHLHIGQKDNEDYCKCENCMALYEKYGSVSAATIIFTNKLAESLEDEFPDIYFTFYAYNETRHAPADTSLTCDDNVIPVICGSHQACHSHPYYECGQEDGNESFEYTFSEHETTFANDLTTWTKIAKRTYIYEYTINFLNTQQFFSNFATMQPDAAWMKSLGVTGYTYNCGDGHPAAFNELRNYLLCKVMWDTDCDIEYHMKDFLKAYYGEAAAEYIKEYIDISTAKIAATDHAFDFDWHYQTCFFTAKEVKKINELWENALAANVTDTQLYNIEIAEISWRYYKANLLMGEFNPLNLFRCKEHEKLYDDMVSHGITEVTCVGGALPPKDEINFLSRPMSWR